MPKAPNFERLIIENISPTIDQGTYPAKAVVGEVIDVAADIFTDGHGMLSTTVAVRQPGEENWTEFPLDPLGNDRFRATLTPKNTGTLQFRIHAWNDLFGAWLRDTRKKYDAGVDTTLDLKEGEALLNRLFPSKRKEKNELLALLRQTTLPLSEILTQLGSPVHQDKLSAARREDAVTSAIYNLQVERPLASFGAWYEIFPRSQHQLSATPSTFKDCEARLPDIRAMGFDVLYLTPIHPIGRLHRKGRNNSLTAGPDDPGSPYAIGAAEGGHKAVHPALGTLEDFRHFVQATRDAGMEIAMDFAVQCAPDHPYIKEHPDWFRFRPDGTIAYAENPPKKYQDIVNLDFACADAEALWQELRSIILFWIEQGVTIFRVDNPHTKPFAFWQWLIKTVREQHPDVIFLSEAFTRPKIMYYLAKIGFSQSYTYFTWRTTRYELTEYLTELTQTAPKDFFRPNFFPTTPDIFPYHLHGAGKPGFMIRLALAATLAGNYGMYSGYELCEGAPFGKGEEYADSEKYQIKSRDWNAPGNIKPFVTALNRIRKDNAAMRDFAALRFYPSSNDQIIFYGRIAANKSHAIFVAVNLDTRNAQETYIEMPLETLGVQPSMQYRLDDLLLGHSWPWTGKRQHLRLEPGKNPVAIFRWKP